MFHDRGLVTFESCFQHAVLFLGASCAGAGITEVHFNSGDMAVEMGQLLLNQIRDKVREGFTPINGVVRTHFDVHADTLRKCKGNLWLS